MANRLNIILDEIKTALDTLTTGGSPVIRSFKRGVLNPFTVQDFPAMGMVIGTARRAAGSVWSVPVYFPFVVKQTDAGDVNEKITDMAIEIDAVLNTWELSNRTNGGSIGEVAFDVWYHAESGKALAPVGGVVQCTLSVEGPLKTT